MTAEQPLLERIAIQMGCTYLSDLRFLDYSQRCALAQKLEQLHPREEDVRAWNDALAYLTGASPERTARAARDRLVKLLIMPTGGQNKDYRRKK